MEKFDFNEYYDVKDCIDYDGFIAPNGNFYRVSFCNKHNPTHNQWADEFVTNKLDYIKQLANPVGSFLYTISKLNGKIEILIHFYGFIYYGHNSYDRKPIIIYPNYNINNKEVTFEQYNKLFDILYEKNETMYLPINLLEEKDQINHERYVDDYICKRSGGLK